MSNANLTKTTLSAIAVTAALTSSALANQVVLKSRDGAIEVSGQLLASNTDAYVIRTAFGPLSVSKSRVQCVGEECLQEDGFEANLRVLATGNMMQQLLPDALAEMAMSDGSTLDIRAAERGGYYGQLVAQGGTSAEAMKFRVGPAGTKDPLAQLVSGDTDVVFSAGSPALAETPEGVTETQFGQHVLSAVVHPDNPLSEIGLEQLRAVFTGQVTNWQDLGGPDAGITVIHPADGAGMLGILKPTDNGQSIDASALTSAGDAETSRLVGADPHAIGLVGLSAQDTAKTLGIMSACGIATHPDDVMARAGDYPLSLPVTMYHRDPSENPHLADFVRHVQSDAFAHQLETAGYVDTSINVQRDALASLNIEQDASVAAGWYEQHAFSKITETLDGFDRLSMTVQFPVGSSRLDAKDTGDLDRLVTYLMTLPAGTSIVFAGFSDSMGTAAKNYYLSENRAERLERMVLDMMPEAVAERMNISSVGFGEILPRACDEDWGGMDLNRRVEVWLSTNTPS
ncbi:MAG: phosphate ABC transporter substrate-binding/OmpA family protein [Pseudomonadota bacterium]